MVVEFVGGSGCDAEEATEVTVSLPSATFGPGGQEFVVDTQGRTYMAYHAWTAPNTSYQQGGARTLRFASVDLAGDAPSVLEHGAYPSSTAPEGPAESVTRAPSASAPEGPSARR